MKIIIKNLDGKDVTNEYQHETLENLEVLKRLGLITITTCYKRREK